MDTKKIVNSLTNEQLAKYIRGDGFWYLFSNPELGVKKVKMSDGPHGLRTEPDKKDKDKFVFATTYKAICFPSMSLAACSFNKDLIYRLGETLAEEAKHLGVHIILGPAVNIKRDPKCGRNFEYISEDPYVVGELATAYINGVQSHGIGTSIKHFACNNCETDRMVINSVVDERALREIYLFGFEKAIKNSQPYTVMASYNKLNGGYTTESYHLLT
jgi:beta-glucosidase